jgi:hypothetical protein
MLPILRIIHTVHGKLKEEAMFMSKRKISNTPQQKIDQTPKARRKAPDVERKIKEKAEEQR